MNHGRPHPARPATRLDEVRAGDVDQASAGGLVEAQAVVVRPEGQYDVPRQPGAPDEDRDPGHRPSTAATYPVVRRGPPPPHEARVVRRAGGGPHLPGSTAHGGVPNIPRPGQLEPAPVASRRDVTRRVHVPAPRSTERVRVGRTGGVLLVDEHTRDHQDRRPAGPRWSGWLSRRRKTPSAQVGDQVVSHRRGRAREPADLGERLVRRDRAAALATASSTTRRWSRSSAKPRRTSTSGGLRRSRRSRVSRRQNVTMGCWRTQYAPRAAPPGRSAATTSWAKIPSATNSWGRPGRGLPAAAAVLGDVVHRHLGPALGTAARGGHRVVRQPGGGVVPVDQARRWRPR